MSDNYDTFESRTCATCAVSFLVDPPRVDRRTEVAPERGRKRWDEPRNGAPPTPPPPMHPIRICRLNPPQTVQLPNGQVDLVQQIVRDKNVCWHWTRPGKLPGELGPEPTTATQLCSTGPAAPAGPAIVKA